GIRDKKERLGMTLAAVEFLRETGQLTEAERLLQPLLDDPETGKRGSLWRLAAQGASDRDVPARKLECLGRALDAEVRDLPQVIDLNKLRIGYALLLQHYQNLADAMVTLHVEPPRDLVAKVVRTAERWRRLDRDATEPCRSAAGILRRLGRTEASELAWDYLTTPVGLRPNESGPWADLARTLQRQGDLARADQAFA